MIPSSSAPKRGRVSASSLKALVSCTMAFYYERILKLPSKEWPRTIIGTLCHAIFEALRNPRHRDAYDAITAPEGTVDYALSPSVLRLVQWYQRKHNIDNDLLLDLNGMLYVGLKLIDFHWTEADKDPVTGAPLTHGPEHEFKLILPDGTEIKGFIDDMAQVGGIMQIRDFKSQRNRFDNEELTNSIQALVYQLYVWQRFGMMAEVQFIMLRHPPTKRTPQKHIQIVPPASVAHLEGLIHYIEAMALRVGSFSIEDALVKPCDDRFFCQKVCSHYAPHPYWVVAKADDPQGLTPLSSHLELDKATKACKDGEITIERQHKGCLVAWRG